MLPLTPWRFLSDTVMGGVSTGQLALMTGDAPFLRLTGQVSTANRGGFIQMRHDLTAPPPPGTTGLRLIARGNDQRYFVHLRTAATLRPWQFFQLGFDVTGDWATFVLPLTAFGPAPGPDGASLTSVGVVAYGRDHTAALDIAQIGFDRAGTALQGALGP